MVGMHYLVKLAAASTVLITFARAYKSPGSRKRDAMDSLTCISILQHVLYGVMKVGGWGFSPRKKFLNA